MDSIGRQQKVSFLTEKGLYKVLFKSRKPIAEKFCFPLKEEANNNPINKGCTYSVHPLSNYKKRVYFKM